MSLTNDKKKERRDEGFISGSKFEELDTCLMDVSKSVCKLKIELNSEIKYGTGFFLRYPIDGKYIYCLLSNEHIIEEEFIKNKYIMNVSYNYENKSILIKLDKSERYIRSFIDIGLDITLVEILNDDDVYKDYFLFPELDYDIKDLKNKQIYIPQFPLGKKIKNARGIIKNIDEYEFTHLVSTEHSSSGSPIFLNDSKKVVGIHKQGHKKLPENYGDVLYPIFNKIKEDINSIKNITNNNNNELNIKNKDKSKKYCNKFNFYVGSAIILVLAFFFFWNHFLANENGKLYYENGNIKYEGGLKNNKYEGKGILAILIMVNMKVKEYYILKMEISNMKVILSKVNLKEKEYFIMKTELLCIKVTLMMIYLKGKELFIILLENLYIKVIIKIIFLKEKEYYITKMGMFIMKV